MYLMYTDFMHKLLLSWFLFIVFNTSLLFGAEVNNWNNVNYDHSGKLPSIIMRNKVDLTKFIKYDVSRSYNSLKKISNLLIKNNDTLYLVDNINRLIIFDLHTKKVTNRIELLANRKVVSSGISLDVQGNYLFVAFEDGNIVAYSLLSKKIIWQTLIPTPINSAPIVYYNKIFLMSHNNQYAVDMLTGKILWTHFGSKNGISTRMLYAPTVADNYVFFGLSSGDVVILREEQGEQLAIYNIYGLNPFLVNFKPTEGDIKSPLIIFGNKLLIFSNNKTILYDIQKGKEIWTTDKYGSLNPPLIDDTKKVFILDFYNNLLRFNLDTSKIAWKVLLKNQKNTRKRLAWFGPLMINHDLFVMNSVGEVVMLSSDNGKEKDRYVLFKFKKERLYNNPIVTSKYMAILSSYGNLYLYEDN